MPVWGTIVARSLVLAITYLSLSEVGHAVNDIGGQTLTGTSEYRSSWLCQNSVCVKLE